MISNDKAIKCVPKFNPPLHTNMKSDKITDTCTFDKIYICPHTKKKSHNKSISEIFHRI